MKFLKIEHTSDKVDRVSPLGGAQLQMRIIFRSIQRFGPFLIFGVWVKEVSRGNPQ